MFAIFSVFSMFLLQAENQLPLKHFYKSSPAYERHIAACVCNFVVDFVLSLFSRFL